MACPTILKSEAEAKTEKSSTDGKKKKELSWWAGREGRSLCPGC